VAADPDARCGGGAGGVIGLQEASLSRRAWKEIYILTLTLTLLLTLFSATALAFLLSSRPVEPLALLAAGTRRWRAAITAAARRGHQPAMNWAYSPSRSTA